MDGISFELLETVASGASLPYVSFNLQSLGVRMTTDSEGHSISEYDLAAVNLLDLRHNVDNRFPRTLSCSRDSQHLHLTHVSYPSGDVEFMLTLEHPRIVLLPWAYRALWGFVYPLFERALESWDLWVNDGEPPPPPPVAPTASDWVFRVTITDPEIVLVADATQSACEALLLKGTILFKHWEPPNQQRAQVFWGVRRDALLSLTSLHPSQHTTAVPVDPHAPA